MEYKCDGDKGGRLHTKHPTGGELNLLTTLLATLMTILMTTLLINTLMNNSLTTLTQVDEVEVFKGSENSLRMMQTYTHRFQCHFILTRYPFDTQATRFVSRRKNFFSRSVLS